MSYQIIRIEHNIDGFGMMRYKEDKDKYTAGDSEETSELFLRHRELPTPAMDGIVEDYNYSKYEDYFCAFTSMEKFKELCTTEEIKFLLTKDYKVLLLNVSTVLSGSFQVMYKKEDIISCEDISSLFKD